jgi:uncharacterized protein YggU (UPF0235/DUF167 family)
LPDGPLSPGRDGLPRRDLAIVAGAASRHKTVRVAGDPQLLLDRLGTLIAALPGP